jgi:hypothetical protein
MQKDSRAARRTAGENKRVEQIFELREGHALAIPVVIFILISLGILDFSLQKD